MRSLGLSPGIQLDRYQLLAPVAEGGMGQVWLARLLGKRGFEKLVALKVSKVTGDSDHQQMFLEEARIASAIEHVNVARMLELGEEDDILYIVMEWVDGDSLSTLLRRLDKSGTSLPHAIALWVLHETCAGVHAAHDLQDPSGHPLEVVHRDISPQNILLARNGGVKLIDFGIAKARSRLSGETAAGTIKGKMKYMAPEQARGSHVDRRADIFSLGAVLYRMLAGRPPFEAENEVATLKLILSDARPPPLPEEVPAPLAEITMRALASDPADRFQTAAEMQFAIARAMTDLALSTTGPEVATFLSKHLTSEQKKRDRVIGVALRDATDRGSVPARVAKLLRSKPSEFGEAHDPSSASSSLTGAPLPSGMYASMPAPSLEVTGPMQGRTFRLRTVFSAAVALGVVGVILIVLATGGTARRGAAAASKQARAPEPPSTTPSAAIVIRPSAPAQVASAYEDDADAKDAAPKVGGLPTPKTGVPVGALPQGTPKPRASAPAARPTGTTPAKPAAPDFGY